MSDKPNPKNNITSIVPKLEGQEPSPLASARSVTPLPLQRQDLQVIRNRLNAFDKTIDFVNAYRQHIDSSIEASPLSKPFNKGRSLANKILETLDQGEMPSRDDMRRLNDRISQIQEMSGKVGDWVENTGKLPDSLGNIFLILDGLVATRNEVEKAQTRSRG